MSKKVDRNKKAKGAVLIALLAGVLVIFVAGYLYNIYHEYREDQVSERIVEVPIGAYTFAFPRNAINHVRYGDENAPRSTSVELVFILPKMEMITSENRNRLSPENGLTVYISASHYEKIEGLRARSESNKDLKLDLQKWIDIHFKAKTIKGDGFAYPRIGQGKKVGDLFLYERNEKESSHQDLYSNASEPIEFLLECTPNDSPLSRLNPVCSLHATMLGHMFVNYNYPKKYIPQATQINQFIMSYLQSHFKGVTEHE